jgi:hypothetical protein
MEKVGVELVVTGVQNGDALVLKQSHLPPREVISVNLSQVMF